MWTITSAEVHRLLTRDRGWSAERYETWLAETLDTLLLPALANREQRGLLDQPSRYQGE